MKICRGRYQGDRYEGEDRKASNCGGEGRYEEVGVDMRWWGYI